MLHLMVLMVTALQGQQTIFASGQAHWLSAVSATSSKVHQMLWQDMQEAAAIYDSKGDARKAAAAAGTGGAFPDAELQILHPTEGMVLTDRDLPMPGALLLRCRTKNFMLKKDGYLAVKVRRLEDADGTATLIVATEPNTMFITSATGLYYVTATLTTWNNVPLTWGRTNAASALRIQKNVTFTILRGEDEAVWRATGISPDASWRKDGETTQPWMVQPTHATAAYVVVLTSNDYTDLVMAWAQSLKDTGSQFRRICLVAEGLVTEDYTSVLRDCCCAVIQVPPITAPASSKFAEQRYRWLLTKFQIWKINTLPEILSRGWQFVKVILMDADTLVLQNIDELFWTPAPAATVGAHAIMGFLRTPTISSGLMVIEPSEEVFAQLENVLTKPDIGSSGFLEQEVLDDVFTDGGKPKYHVLPFVYNFYPEISKRMDFVHPDLQTAQDFESRPHFSGEEEQAFIEDSAVSSVKVVHFWGLYNPVFAVFDHKPRAIQASMSLRDSSMWRWYRIWWRAHQRSMKALIGAEQYAWLVQICEGKAAHRDVEMVPLLGGRGNSPVCYHPPTGFPKN